jgi:chromosome segregation ATPase
VNGCAADATEEQLKQIQALEDEIAALKKSMADKNGEKGRVQSDINGKQAKLDRCARDKETVKQRLATFQEPR